jgi:hypothetical protein
MKKEGCPYLGPLCETQCDLARLILKETKDTDDENNPLRLDDQQLHALLINAAAHIRPQDPLNNTPCGKPEELTNTIEDIRNQKNIR